MRAPSILLGTLVIASAGTSSTVLDLRKAWLRGLTIFAPAALTGAVKVYVSGDAGVTYQILQSGGADVYVGAGDAVPLDYVGWTHLKVVSGSAEGAERTFVVRGVEDVT